MWRVRLRSPLRWLSAVMGGMLVFGMAGIFDQPWLILGVPLIIAIFVLAPPIWVYRHEEALVEHASLSVVAEPAADRPATFVLTMVNDAAVPAADFRLRILVPHRVVPMQHQGRLLGNILVGEMGRNWFVDAAVDSTAITFRAAQKGEKPGILCPAHGRLPLAELSLPPQGAPWNVTLDYQVSGGSAAPALSTLAVRSQR